MDIHNTGTPIQRGLAIEADALRHAAAWVRSGGATALDTARWEQLPAEATARSQAPTTADNEGQP